MLGDPTRVPTAPQDELDIVAAVLMGADPERLHLTPSHFDNPQTGRVWQAILNVAQTGGRPDPTTVRLALGPDGDKAASWLIDVFGRPVVAANADIIAAKIRRTAQLRDLQSLAIKINQLCVEGTREPDAIAELIRHEIDKPTGASHGTETFADILPSLIDEIQHGTTAGLPTPWPQLNQLIHGLTPGALYIVAARPAQGKSLLGQNLAVHWSRTHRQATYLASLEMQTKDVGKRALAQTSRVHLSKIQSGKGMLESDWQRIDAAAATLMEDMIHICPDGGQTLESIRAGARELKRRRGLGMVIVDYLQLVRPSNPRAPREQQVAETSRGLKLLAKELEVPVVAMAQLRRLNDGERVRKPTLNDLRESGAIEQDADVVMLLHTPDEDKRWQAELLVAKARSGETGPVHLEMRTHWATILPGDAPTHYDQRETA